jgi:phenylacetate-CoA ligase
MRIRFRAPQPAPELFHLAVVDEDGAPVPDGQPGLLCLSHLDRRGTVLLRYVLGDTVVLSHDPCPRCGRSGERVVAHLGRTGSRVKIRGQLVDRRVLLDALYTIDGLGVYQARLRRENPPSPANMDELVVVIEDAAPPSVEHEVVTAVHRATGVRPRVTWASVAAIHDPHQEFKHVRFVDERNRPDRAD